MFVNVRKGHDFTKCWVASLLNTGIFFLFIQNIPFLSEVYHGAISGSVSIS